MRLRTPVGQRRATTVTTRAAGRGADPRLGPLAPLAAAGNRALQRVVVQRAEVKTYNGVDPKLGTQVALQELLDKAEAKGGGPSGGPMLTRLEQILLQAAATNLYKPNGQVTYGLSGKGSGDTETIYAQGPGKFFEAVSSVVGNAVDLGNRGSRVHDEVTHLKNDGAIEAVLSTQDNCLFCYGVLEKLGKQHGSLRMTRYPEGWNHPTHGFELQRSNAQKAATLKQMPAIKIKTSLSDQRGYYRVQE